MITRRTELCFAPSNDFGAAKTRTDKVTKFEEGSIALELIKQAKIWFDSKGIHYLEKLNDKGLPQIIVSAIVSTNECKNLSEEFGYMIFTKAGKVEHYPDMKSLEAKYPETVFPQRQNYPSNEKWYEALDDALLRRPIQGYLTIHRKPLDPLPTEALRLLKESSDAIDKKDFSKSRDFLKMVNDIPMVNIIVSLSRLSDPRDLPGP